MKRLLIALSGARPEVLARCPTEQGKFEGIGGAVLTTSVLAVVSMTFALHSALGVALFFAIPVSLLWGLAILSLDRWLVSTMRADSPNRFRLALPRVLMAVLLGVVISTPLVLQIFKSEIDAQIVQIKLRAADTFTLDQQRGAAGKNVGALTKQVNDLQKVIDSRGDVPLDPRQDPKYKSLTAERDKEQKQVAKLTKDLDCQINGLKGCKKGDGAIAQEIRGNLNKAKNRVAALTSQLETRKKALNATDAKAKQARLEAAQAAIPAAKDKLAAAVEAQRKLQAEFDTANPNTDGLLIRLQALNEVAGKDVTMRGAHILLFLLFMLIECLPVTVKLMQRPGNYERILALAEEHEFRDAKGSFGARAVARAAEGESAFGSWNLWKVWTAPPQQPASTLKMTKPEEHPRANGAEPYPSMDDDALRHMGEPGATTTFVQREAGRPTERPGGFELLPDDD